MHRLSDSIESDISASTVTASALPSTCQCSRPQCSYIGGVGTQCGGRTNCANGLSGDDCTPDPQNAKHGAGISSAPHVDMIFKCKCI